MVARERMQFLLTEYININAWGEKINTQHTCIVQGER